MTPDQREAIIDAIPDGIDIWEHDEEPADYRRDWRWWRRQLNHPHVDGRGYCKTCGPAVSCTLAVFHDAVVATVVRQLDQLGVLGPIDVDTAGGFYPTMTGGRCVACRLADMRDQDEHPCEAPAAACDCECRGALDGTTPQDPA